MKKTLFFILPLLVITVFAQEQNNDQLELLQTTGRVWFLTKDNPDFPPPHGYHAVYWNPKSNEYFYATGEGKYGNLMETNGFSFKLDPTKQETNYIQSEQDYLQYLGDISTNKKVYLGKDGKQYVKVFQKITNDTSAVYPVIGQGITFYTNTNGQKYGRTIGNKYQRSKGTLQEF